MLNARTCALEGLCASAALMVTQYKIGVCPLVAAELNIVDCDISALFLGGGKSIIHGVLRVKMPEEQDIGR